MTFVPLMPVPPGELLPCGSNPSGTIREFFANARDVDELLAAGITLRVGGRVERYGVKLTSTPYYMNGDVQVQAVLVNDVGAARAAGR